LFTLRESPPEADKPIMQYLLRLSAPGGLLPPAAGQSRCSGMAAPLAPWVYGTLDFFNDRVKSESEQTRRTGTGQSMAALEKILNHEE